MVWSEFKVRVPGKWVLAGEHSVLRGAAAVALPHPELGLSLSFQPDKNLSGMLVDPLAAAELMGELIVSIATSWKEQGKAFELPEGKLVIESDIPIGAGLGSSAALCVALTQWMADPLQIPKSLWSEFATQLEHRFHGKSSGMDVAVITAGEPISFLVGQAVQTIGIKKLPKFTFHDTGLRSRTSDCVARVEAFHTELPAVAVRVDEAMGEASCLALEGLVEYDSGNTQKGLNLIQSAMRQARECFYCWQLVPGEAKRLEDSLLKQGALAVKLTGAGGGGVVVALWPENSEAV